LAPKNARSTVRKSATATRAQATSPLPPGDGVEVDVTAIVPVTAIPYAAAKRDGYPRSGRPRAGDRGAPLTLGTNHSPSVVAEVWMIWTRGQAELHGLLHQARRRQR
jgi:hypothetical protein